MNSPYLRFKPRLTSNGQNGYQPPAILSSREIDEPGDPRLQALLAYWTGKLAGRAMPVRHDIRPSEIRKLLPIVYLMDVVEGTFRFRLRGTAVDGRLGHGLTGRTVEDCGLGPYLDIVKGAFQSCVDRRAPVTSTGTSRWNQHGDELAYENWRAPLAGPDGAIAMLFCGIVFRETGHAGPDGQPGPIAGAGA